MSLASKTYSGDGGDGLKFSVKGLQRDKVKDICHTMTSILETKESHGVTNIGFRARNNTIFTYSQFRTGLGYYYCKRVVAADGCTTSPLDVVIAPWE